MALPACAPTVAVSFGAKGSAAQFVTRKGEETFAGVC